MAKKKPLEVGQRVWIETAPAYYQESQPRTVREYEVVKTNTSSAYAAFVKELLLDKPYTIRLEQRTHKVVNSYMAGYRFTTWYSKAEFEADIVRSREIAEMRVAAEKKLRAMRYDELKVFVGKV